MSLCLTCYSSINTSEPYRTPCCDNPICTRCLAKNPRLREYNPCLRCGDLTTAPGIDRVRAGRIRAADTQRRSEDVFRIDDEDEDEEGIEDRPPAYDELEAGQDRVEAEDVNADRPGDVGSKSMDEEEREDVEVRHPVGRGDTILSIARRYGADPHEILKLNALPPSVLSTQPHLLRTRKTLVISRRSVLKSRIPNTTLFNSTFDGDEAQSTDAAEEEAERSKRERERAVKRFQLMTKSVDPRIGDAYISLSELDESNLDHLSSLEIDNLLEGGENKGKRQIPSAGNREQRALDAFYDDENWESQVGGPERTKRGGWKTVGPSVNMGVKV